MPSYYNPYKKRAVQTVKYKSPYERQHTNAQAIQLGAARQAASNQAGVARRTTETAVDLAANITTGMLKSVEGIADLLIGVGGEIGGIFSDDVKQSAKSMVAYDATREWFSKHADKLSENSYLNDSKAGQIVEGVAQGIGEMLPAVLVATATGGASLAATGAAGATGAASTAGAVASTASKAGKAVRLASLSTMAAGASGQGVEQALNEGAELENALAYGALTGAAEAGTEALVGGLTSSVFGKGVLKSGKGVAKTGAKRIVKGMAEEAVEEMLAEAANPLISTTYRGMDALNDYRSPEFYKGVGEAGIIGGLTGLAFDQSVGRLLNRAKGADADIDESLTAISTLTKKQTKLYNEGKLDANTYSNIQTNVMENIKNVERVLKKASPEKRARLIKTYEFDGVFNSDGSVSDEYREIMRKGTVVERSNEASPFVNTDSRDTTRHSESGEFGGEEQQAVNLTDRSDTHKSSEISFGKADGIKMSPTAASRDLSPADTTDDINRDDLSIDGISDLAAPVNRPVKNFSTRNDDLKPFNNDITPRVEADTGSRNNDVQNKMLKENSNDTLYIYKEKEYNDFGWAEANGVLSKGENADYQAKFKMLKARKVSFPKTKRSEYMIAVSDIYESKGVENVIVYAKGTLEHPIITKVLRIDLFEESEKLDKKRREFYDAGRRGLQPKIGKLCRFYYGAGSLSFGEYKRDKLSHDRNNLGFNTDRGTGSGKATRAEEVGRSAGGDVIYSPERTDALYQDRHRYTEKEYNDFGWAEANGVLSKGENADYQAKFKMLKERKVRFPKTKRGEYMIAVSDIYQGDDSITSPEMSVGNIHENGIKKQSSMGDVVFSKEELLNIRRDIVKHFNLKGINGFEQVQRSVLNTLRGNGFFESNGERKVLVKENGMEVTINRGSIIETFGNGNKYDTIPAVFKILKLATIEQIPSIIENATVVVENEKNRHYNGENKTFTYLNGTAIIDGKSVPVRITLKITKEKNRFWVHHIGIKKETDDIFPLGAKNASPTISKLSSAGDIITQINPVVNMQLKKYSEKYASDTHTTSEHKKGNTNQLLNIDSTESPQLTPEASFDSSATKSIVTQEKPFVNRQSKKHSALDSKSKGVENVIVYAKGTIEHPIITKVLRIDLFEESEKLDKKRREFYDAGRRGLQPKIGELFRFYYGADGRSYGVYKRDSLENDRSDGGRQSDGGAVGGKAARAEEIGRTGGDIIYYHDVDDVKINSESSFDITANEVETIRSIGKKSISQFNLEDMEKAHNWEQKFNRELGIKSPFFRARFGDWRAYEPTKITPISFSVKISSRSDAEQYLKEGLKRKTLFRGNVKNNDSGFLINIGAHIYNDTLTYANRQYSRDGNKTKYINRISLLSKIEDIVKHSVLLDTETVKKESKNPNQLFVHRLFSVAQNQYEKYLVKLTVDELISVGDTVRRAYNIDNIEISPVAVSRDLGPADTTDDINGDDLSINSISDLFAIVKRYDRSFSPKPVDHKLLNADGTPNVFYVGTESVSAENKLFNNGDALMLETDMSEQKKDVRYQDRDLYTENDYNAFGWVRANGFLSVGENADYQAKFKMLKARKVSFPKTKRSEYMIAVSDIYESKGVENVIVYAKGTIEHPIITKVLRIDLFEESEKLRKIRREIYDAGRRGLQPKIGKLCRFYYGTGSLSFGEYKRDKLSQNRNNLGFNTDRRTGSGKAARAEGAGRSAGGDVIYYHEELMRSLNKLRDLKNDKFISASDYKPHIFKSTIERLTGIDLRGNINASATREITADLLKWYQKENPMLGYEEGGSPGYYSEYVANMLEELSLFEGEFTEKHFSMLKSIVDHFTHIAKNYSKIFDGKEWVDTGIISRGYINNIIKAREVQSGVFYKTMENKYSRDFADPAALFRAADAYNENGFFTAQFEQLRRKVIDMSVMEMELFEELDGFLKENSDYAKILETKTHELGGVELTVGDIISFYLTTKRLAHVEKLNTGGFYAFDKKKTRLHLNGFKDASGQVIPEDKINDHISELRRIAFDKLEERDKKYIEIVEKIYSRCSELKREADTKRFGVSNVGGKYYYPIRRYDVRRTVGSTYVDEVECATNPSFNKSAVKSSGMLLIEPVQTVLERHARSVLLYSELGIWIENVNRLLNENVGSSNTVKQTLRNEIEKTPYTRKMLDSLLEIKNSVDGVMSESDREYKKIMGFVRGAYAKSMLAFNPKVPINQLTSILAATSIIDTRFIGRGFAVKGIFKEVDKYCPLAKLRHKSNSAVKSAMIVDKLNKLEQAGMSYIEKTDRLVIAGLFGSCQLQIERDEGKAVGTEENKKAAGELLERVILETQQNYLVTERTSAARSDDELKKSFVMFMSDAIKVSGRVIDSYGEHYVAKRRSKQLAGKINKASAALRSLEKERKRLADELESIHSRIASTQILPDMNDDERHEALKGARILIEDARYSDEDLSDIQAIEQMQGKAKSQVEKIIVPMAERAGILGKPLKTPDIDFEFKFSKNEGLGKSLNSQLYYGGSYSDFAKIIANMDTVLKNAVLIEQHGDKYTSFERNLERVYVLISALRDGDSIIPIELEIKKFKNEGGRLYLNVAMTKIEADVMASTVEKDLACWLLSASTYSIADVFANVNSFDKNFLKYVPDKFLSNLQKKSKAQSLMEEKEKILAKRAGAKGGDDDKQAFAQNNASSDKRDLNAGKQKRGTSNGSQYSLYAEQIARQKKSLEDLEHRISDEKADKTLIRKDLKISQKKLARSLSSLVSTSIFLALVSLAFSAFLGRHDDDEPEEVAASFIADTLGNMLGGLPIFSDIYSFLSNGYEIDIFAIDMLNNALESCKYSFSLFESAVSGEPVSGQRVKSAIEKTLTSAGMAVGVPVKNIYRYSSAIVKKIDASMGYRYDSLFGKKVYSSDLKKAIESGDARLVSVVSQLLTEQNAAGLSKNLKEDLALLEGEGYDVLPRTLGDTVTYNATQYKLSDGQKKKFRGVYSKANEAADRLIRLGSFKNASSDIKASSIRFIYDLYWQMALEEALGESENGKNSLFSRIIQPERFALIVCVARSIEADRDANGNVIQGSKKRKVIEYLEGQDLTAVQKHMLAGYLGYKNTRGEKEVLSYISRLDLSPSEKQRLAEYSGYKAA